MDSVFLHPELKRASSGSAAWFAAQRAMMNQKPLVRRCYELWYSRLLADADSVLTPGPIVELGSGSSFIKELRPSIMTDVTPGVADMTIDGRSLPFPDKSVRALLPTHTSHHIPDVGRFLSEASRVLVPGGVISMVDETHTPFARFFFGKIHPEPYDDAAAEWRLQQCSYLPWFSYLMSGGVNLRTFFPRFLTRAVGSAPRVGPVAPFAPVKAAAATYYANRWLQLRSRQSSRWFRCCPSRR